MVKDTRDEKLIHCFIASGSDMDLDSGSEDDDDDDRVRLESIFSPRTIAIAPSQDFIDLFASLFSNTENRD